MQYRHVLRVFRFGFAAFAAVLLASAGSVMAAPAAKGVSIDSGKLEGVVSGGVLSFKGIPFAAPPVGALRWRPPQPAAHWSGIRKADSYGSDCMQVPFPSDAAPLGTPPRENCLYLNVWRPAEASSKPLPVMVWIYGGGFVNGGSSPAVYDGSAFARQGVILVSFNYRLGRFGFFGFPALTREAKATGDDLGNYAYMDQIAALKWVQRNIAAFGGDPDNVTIFGESAGGASVLALLTSPEARGLFNKAVCESGGGRGSLLGLRPLSEKGPNGAPSAEDIGVALAKSVGVDGTDAAALKALRAVPAQKILDGLNMATMGKSRDTYVGGPILDGKIVTGSAESVIRAGKEAPVPVLIGANSADIGFSLAKTKDELFATFGDHADEARKAFDPDGTRDLRAVAAEVAMDRTMVEPARLVATLVAKQGHASYNYRFSYVAKSIRKPGQGAPHASEIPYVFDTVAAKYGKALAPDDEAIAKAANSYWVNFAKTSDPNGPGLPHWPRFDPAKDTIMNFTEQKGPVGGPDPWKAKLDVITKSASSP